MNKVERVKALFNNEKTDMVPAGFWFHYSHDFDEAKMAEVHLETFRKTDADILKVMQDYLCPIEAQVKVPSDWKNIRFPGTSSPVFKKLNDVLKRILDGLAGEALAFQTMYGPFKCAVIAYGDALVMAHSKQDPDAVAAGVGVIAEALAEWAGAFIETGAGGIYYAAQFSEPGRFTREQWEKLVKPADLAVMNAAAEKGSFNILHICGEPDYQFKTRPEWFSDYPFSIVNWSVKDNGLSLEQGRDIFKGKPILGGMNNKGNILSGADSAIAEEARAVIKSFGTKGLMLGADCTIQGKGISLEKIRAAVDAAHCYR
jgi:uroporphyrinogen decarboxylase